MIGGFAGLVVLLQVYRSETFFFDLDEMNARNAVREDRTQNGWYDLDEAMKLLPDRPDVPLGENARFAGKMRSHKDSIGGYLGLFLPDSHPLMLDYVEDCRPAFDRARFALEKPELLCDWPRVHEWHFAESNKELGLDRLYAPMSASVRMDFFYNDEPERGASTLLFLLRLQHRARKDLARDWETDLVLTANLMDRLIIETNSIRVLGFLEDVYGQTNGFEIDGDTYLKRWFNVLDNTNHNFTTPAFAARGTDLEDKFLIWQIGQSTNLLYEQADLLDELLDLPASEHMGHFLNSGEDGKTVAEILPDTLVLDMKYYFLTNTIVHLGQMDSYQAKFDKHELMFALQRFFIERGAYPESEEDLVPDYLAAMPINPVSDTPYRYERAGLGYTIKGDGFDFIQYDRTVVEAEEIEFVKEDQFEFREESSIEQASSSEQE